MPSKAAKKRRLPTPKVITERKTKEDTKIWFAIPDIHFPEQDDVAIATVLKAHANIRPTHTLLLGDVLDCGLFSAHESKTTYEERLYSYQEAELDPAISLIDKLQKNTKEHTFVLEGNHEARIERWCVRSGRTAQAIFPLLNPATALSKGRKNFSWIPYSVPTGARRGFVQLVAPSSHMKTGGLVAVHGWSFAQHAAAVHLSLSRSQSILYGHTHRQELKTGRDPWTGSIIKAFCPGTLSKLEPLYATGGCPTSWLHGFSIIYVGKTSWTEYLISIVDGHCVLPDGKEIKV